MTISPAIAAPITDLASAKAWIEGIDAAGLMFHFEDSPETIINGRTDQMTFTPDEVPIVRERVASLYALDWGEFDCPIGYALVVMAAGEDADPDTVSGELQAKIRAGKMPGCEHLLPENNRR